MSVHLTYLPTYFAYFYVEVKIKYTILLAAIDFLSLTNLIPNYTY